MSWRDAPLYVRSHDLARWVTERAMGWQRPNAGLVGRPLCDAAQDLLCAVGLALTFPRRRTRHLQGADEAVVRLRLRLRLARDVGLLSAGGHRHAAGELVQIGRMLGGWRKRVDRRRRPSGPGETETQGGDMMC